MLKLIREQSVITNLVVLRMEIRINGIFLWSSLLAHAN